MDNLYKENIQLKDYNSFTTAALARYYAEPKNEAELKQCIIDSSDKRVLILGGGNNVFFTKDFDGLVIRPQLFGIKKIDDQSIKPNQVLIEAMASENWDQFVQYCVDHNYANLENLSLIPGTVGASPVQNIGAYGVEVKDCIHTVRALDLKTGKIKVFTNSDCLFAYRDSIFKQTENYIIISVSFILNKSFSYIPKYNDLNKALEHIKAPTIEDVRSAVIKIRENKLPNEKVLPNAGSFFKNPLITRALSEKLKLKFPDLPLFESNNGLLKTSAAFLIDKAGLKGKRDGFIGTYPNHALIIVNYGSTDGNDIISFMKMIQEKVFDLFEIMLEPEVRIL